MPFFLDGNPTQGEISEAINYLLGNSQLTTSTNIVNGQVTDAVGSVVSYLYKYLYVKYADSFDGTVNFSNTPTNRQYYGLRNNDSATESTNPADYIWYQVSGGFSTNKFVFYSVTGGRRINIVVGLSAPSILYQADSGAAIDLDRISGSDGSSSRICYAKSTSTSLASTPTTYQTSGPSGFPPTNTWGGAETWQATPPTLAVNEALFQSDGIYNPVTDLTTWNVPYLSNLRVGALSAISANLGTVTAGELIISGSGGTPTISGTTMTGTGTHLYSDGKFALGDSNGNIVYNGTSVYINGFAKSATTSTLDLGLIFGPINLLSFTVTKAGPVFVSMSGNMTAQSTNSLVVAFNVSARVTIFNSSGANMAQSSIRFSGGASPYASLGGIEKFFISGVSFNKVIQLPVDSYYVQVNLGSSNGIDSSGNVIPGSVFYTGMSDVLTNSFQILA